jgi:undecaprenyl-diphosphatase
MVVAHSGDSPIWLAAVLLVWLWPALAGWRPQAELDLAGMLLAAAIVQLVKWGVRRPRPAGPWGKGYRRLDPHSFPSGHAARATALAVVALIAGPLPWAALLVLWAPSVALARVGLRVHYLSDVIAGAVCGLACGLAAAWLGALMPRF